MSTKIATRKFGGPTLPFIEMDEFVDFVFLYLQWKIENDEQFREETAYIWLRVSLNTLYLTHQELLCAIFYRSLGWSIFPTKPWSKDPFIKWKEFQTRLPGYRELFAWFASRKFRNAGIALVLGPVSKVLCVDVDGTQAHQVLMDHVQVDSDALHSVSGSHAPHKYHLFFRHPNIETISSYRPWEETLEFRGNKGIVLLPPSTHKSGLRYEWACDLELFLSPLPDVPDAILKALTKRAKNIASPARTTTTGRAPISPSCFSRFGTDDRERIIVGYLPLLTRNAKEFINGKYAYQNNWNNRLFRAACDLRGLEIPEDVAISLLLKGARPMTQEDVDKAVRTIESAYAEARIPGREYGRKRQP